MSQNTPGVHNTQKARQTTTVNVDAEAFHDGGGDLRHETTYNNGYQYGYFDYDEYRKQQQKNKCRNKKMNKVSEPLLFPVRAAGGTTTTTSTEALGAKTA